MVDDIANAFSRRHRQKEKDDSQKKAPRELNPFFSDGGSGMPPPPEDEQKRGQKRPREEGDDGSASSDDDMIDTNLQRRISEGSVASPNGSSGFGSFSVSRSSGGDPGGSGGFGSFKSTAGLRTVSTDTLRRQSSGKFDYMGKASNTSLEERVELDEKAKKELKKERKKDKKKRKKGGDLKPQQEHYADDAGNRTFIEDISGFSVEELQMDVKKEKEQKSNTIDYRKMAADRLSKDCKFCLSDSVPNRILVAAGHWVYLSLPPSGQLCEGHCWIVPMNHRSHASDFTDEEEVEIRNFKKTLIQMFAKEEKECTFLYQCIHLDRVRHTYVECFPLDEDAAEVVDLTFVQELRICDDEFARVNKSMTKIQKGKPIGQSVPGSFPFFACEFGLDTGYIHTIEDELAWKPTFGRDIIAGLLDEHGGRYKTAKRRSNVVYMGEEGASYKRSRHQRKGLTEEEQEEREEARELREQRKESFQAAYRSFDWTAQLHETRDDD